MLFNGTHANCLTNTIVNATGFIDQTTDQSAWTQPSFSMNITAGTPPAIVLSVLEGAGAFLIRYASGGFSRGTDWTLGNRVFGFLRWAYVPIGEIWVTFPITQQ